LIETNVALNMYSIFSIYNKLCIFSYSVLLDKSESLSSLFFFPPAQTFFYLQMFVESEPEGAFNTWFCF